MKRSLELYLGRKGRLVERALSRRLRAGARAAIPFLAPIPETLRKAMNYSLMAGGKRLRPILVMAAAECCRLPARKTLKAACALEMIHTYSLIHDDLPAMDDDDLRRGKPTNHNVFGEAVAILAGDGLLTAAFELAAENGAQLRLPGLAVSELIRVISAGAGSRGMVGGQAADLEAEGWKEGSLKNNRNNGGDPSANRARRWIEYIHIHKTAALITASLETGAVLAQAKPSERKALREYGRAIGLAFQITDDVLDIIGDKKKLGKRGSDEDNQKLTYPRLYGIERSRLRARELASSAQKSLRIFSSRAAPLLDLAEYIVTRDR